MASVFTALGDLIRSIFQLVASMFQTIFDLIEGLVKLAVDFLSSVLALFGDTTKGVLNVLGGVGNFLIANAAVIAVAVAAGYGYLVYQRRQGKPVVVQGKKLN